MSPPLAAPMVLMLRAVRGGVVGAMICLAAAAPAGGVTIQFNYDYDAAGFFGSAASPTPARHALEFAARAYSAFADTLAPIVPGGADSWMARFANPSSGAQTSIANLTVPTNQIIVMAGARNLAGPGLGEASPGGHTFSNPGALSQPFLDAVLNRGQGPATADYAPWGGSIAFDTTESDGDMRSWHFDPHSAPEFPANDFLSVAMHELGHLLGFGFSASSTFAANVQGGQFTGPAAMNLYGAPVPLDGDLQHWDSAVTSPPFLTNPPSAAMGSTLFTGQRQTPTPLDYAALADVGWEVPPELLRLPGDVDGDHVVDSGDFLTWQRGMGGFGGTPGDANGDLFVDDYDGWMIRQHFGAAGTPGAGAASAGVPEPGSALLLLISAPILDFGFWILDWRRGRSRIQNLKSKIQNRSPR